MVSAELTGEALAGRGDFDADDQAGFAGFEGWRWVGGISMVDGVTGMVWADGWRGIHWITAKPMGPPPRTRTLSPSWRGEAETACHATARGSTRAVRGLVFEVDETGTRSTTRLLHLGVRSPEDPKLHSVGQRRNPTDHLHRLDHIHQPDHVWGRRDAGVLPYHSAQ